MKIGVILGRGVEGVGLTKNVVEFQKLFPGVEVYATIDKLWQRMNSMDFKVNYFRGTDWNEISKPTKKFPDLLTCSQVVERINQLDMCIVWSVPSKSHPEDCINNFIKIFKIYRNVFFFNFIWIIINDIRYNFSIVIFF